MHQLVQAIGYVNLVAYIGLAFVTVRQWRTRRDPAAVWIALAFCAIAIVEIFGRVAPQEPHSVGGRALQRIDIAVLLLFPYLLFRFTAVFRPSRRLTAGLSAMTVVMIVWTGALPPLPASGEPRPVWLQAYVVAFVVHWAVLSVAAAWRLWRAGGRQPAVARHRMHMLAFAAGTITVALILVAFTSDSSSPVAAAGSLLALVSAAAFLLGLAPPALLRLVWRREETERLQQAVADLLTLAQTPREIAERVVAPMAQMVGARAVRIAEADGSTLAEFGRPGGEEPLELPIGSGSVCVWASRYAPYFGSEELSLLRTLASLTEIALDRARLSEQEHAARLALEHANEMKTNFVALAAHELRTPVTTIHGFVQTLHRLGDRLSEDERATLRQTLEEQTQRMAMLVEQLLDLSRLDADAIEIHPQRVRVRDRVEEIVRGAAADRLDAVRVDVDDDLEATVDTAAFERIVTNLVTNAFRYGEPPVIVHAERSDNHLRIAVEDRGHGVPAEFVPDLFERFTRSRSAGGRSVGTGLGLAIARSYARAHSGELLYEPASPHGARFQLVLPAPKD